MSRNTIILIHHLTGVRVRYTPPVRIAVAIHCPVSLRLQPPLSGLSKHFYQLLKTIVQRPLQNCQLPCRMSYFYVKRIFLWTWKTRMTRSLRIKTALVFMLEHKTNYCVFHVQRKRMPKHPITKAHWFIRPTTKWGVWSDLASLKRHSAHAQPLSHMVITASNKFS